MGAALRAARKMRDAVTMSDFYEANDRVVGGLEKRISSMTLKEKEMIAHHEAGHAVAGWFLENAEPLLKVTIIPRASGALGFAQYLPKELQLYNKDQLYDMMCMALGGRAAEQLFYGKVSTGAADDLNKVTKIAYGQISVYGMNDKLGNLSFPPENQEGGMVTYRPYSEKTAELIDEEATKLVKKAYDDTLDLLGKYKDKVADLAKAMMDIKHIWKIRKCGKLNIRKILMKRIRRRRQLMMLRLLRMIKLMMRRRIKRKMSMNQRRVNNMLTCCSSFFLF